MKLEEIKTALEELSALTGGWNAAGRISELERDLALEKLRRIYEAIRFAPSDRLAAEPEEASSSVMPVNLDLDLMLEIEPLEDSAETKPGTDAEAAESAEPERAPEPSAEAVEKSDRVQETAAFPASPIADPSIRQSESSSETQRVAATGEERTGCAEGEALLASEPASERPAVVEPALFGMDEIVQHKRKQRVIMSLYDDYSGKDRAAKEPQREPAGKSQALPRTELRSEKKAAEPISGTGSLAEEPLAERVTNSDTERRTETERTSSPAPEAAEPVKGAEGDAAVDVQAAGAVLGEVINRGMQTLGETIAPQRDAVWDMAHKTPVADLREAIGINDKFLLIRDLFDGDAEACDAAIDRLNAFTDLDDCLIHIAEHYAWNPNSDGARLLMELLERKLA